MIYLFFLGGVESVKPLNTSMVGVVCLNAHEHSTSLKDVILLLLGCYRWLFTTEGNFGEDVLKDSFLKFLQFCSTDFLSKSVNEIVFY